MSADFAIDDWLREEGLLDAQGLALARAALVAAGLTTGKKQRMAVAKRERAREAAWAALAGWCGAAECRAAADATGKIVVLTVRERCAGCGGSNALQAARAAAAACRRANLRRAVVLGGSPAARQEALRLAQAAGGPELVFVDGDSRVTEGDARADKARADVVLAWAGTPLPHKVSDLYRRREAGDPPFITVPTTGVGQLFRALEQHARSRRP
ncbi:hypothetical protein [Tepidiforma sp.]|uniref:hypothetical protein n=1 Tax=Tepidiforma sp. TaxID=2682230 RepID=UPI002617BE4E|nr:hypothetical protein [Tepidiforma sp.]MCX7618408.1 hypothetical protein [Tepidiforma sp.]